MKTGLLDINSLIRRVDAFPTLPTIYYRLIEIMDNPRSTVMDVSEIISSDQSSAAKVLKAANSPIYGFYGRIESISQAISYIGFDEVKNLVIAMTIIDFFNKHFENRNFNPVKFWQHSIGVGIMSRLIGQYLNASGLEVYFLAGIMHDIGKLLFHSTIPDEYSSIIKYAVENEIHIRDAELKFLGLTHDVAGEILAEKWSFPQSIKCTIRYHSNGISNNKHREIVAATHVSNIAVNMYGYGYSDSGLLPSPNKAVWNILDLPNNFFSNFNKQMTDSYIDSSNLLLRQND